MFKILKGIVMVIICRCLRRELILFCFLLNFMVLKVGNNIGKDEIVVIIQMKKIIIVVKLNKVFDGNKSGDEL